MRISAIFFVNRSRSCFPWSDEFQSEWLDVENSSKNMFSWAVSPSLKTGNKGPRLKKKVLVKNVNITLMNSF